MATSPWGNRRRINDNSSTKARRINNVSSHRRLRMEALEDRRMLAVVINEIHYNASDNTSTEEFVELVNTAGVPVDLSGWRFTDGIDYTFANGTQIPAGGYLVIAENPATLLSEFGANALGPYEGGLSNGGERIAISDALGVLVDEVEYGTSFPWPIAPDGEGPSMELIDPSLDNNLGSNWRPAFTEPLFATPDVDPPSSAGSGLVHRWSFSGNLEDSVGGANGTLVDPTGLSAFTSGQLDVSSNSGQRSDQSPFQDGAYVDLPNGIISSLGQDATFEWWGTVSRNRTWAEIFSFGTSNGGEDQSSGATTQNYLTLIPESGFGDLMFTHRNGATQNESQSSWTQPADTNREYHFTVVWDGDVNTQRVYVDGQLVASGPTLIDLDDLSDNNNWLGRSQWNDPLFDGFHNEFRIYNTALSDTAVAASFVDGPDAVLNVGPTITDFSANASSIIAGQSVTLSWDVDGEDSLSLDPGAVDVTGQTNIIVSPATTTTYTLLATNASGMTSRSIVVDVSPRRATPGGTNASLVVNAAPAIEEVIAVGGEESSSGSIVTAEVSDPDGVASVVLQYQVVLPGDYVPARLPVPINELLANPDLEPTANPDYFDLSNWTNVAMVDDGTGADQIAGDGIYTASLPAQAHRTLVRYRVEVTDALGAMALAPYADDASLNFAYFVYDGVPEYLDNSEQVIADAAALESLPIYHLLTRADDHEEAYAWDSADQIPQFTEARSTYNWGGTMVYNGIVYDNIQYRPRGANGRYFGDGKRSMRYRFNDGSWFQPLDQNGDAYPEQWRTLTTGKGFDNHSTLTYALNEAITMQLSNLMGLPALDTHWFQFRVIDDVAEAPDQWNGDFWGINFALEDYDKRFLDAHGLEEGNLYKLINQSQDALRQQDYQAPNAVTDGSDHDYVEFVMGRGSNDIEERVNLDKYFIFHALSEAVRHYDYWETSNKNMTYYFEPDYTEANDNLGKLWLLLWDTDASWGPTWNEGHDLVYDSLFENFDQSYADSVIKPGYYNTLRELRDLIWQPDQIEGMITELASNILPLEAADRTRWQNAPSSAGNYDGLGGAGIVSIDNLIQDMLNFAFVGGNWPSGGAGVGGAVQSGGRAAYLDDVLAASGEQALIPFTPTISYVGDPGMAVNELSFQTTPFNDPQGSGTFGALQWRLSEVTPISAGLDPNTPFLDEWTTSWDSGALTSFDSTISPSAADVTPGSTYRARVRMQDDTGRWSHWSDPVEFMATASTEMLPLRITELHYHPNNPGLASESDQEFIEVLNTGNSTIDLSGVQIADFANVPYVFDNGQTLAAGEYLVIARTPLIFTSIYGNSINLAPSGYSDSNLSNGGETVSLRDASGQIVHSVTYSDLTPWPTSPDGDGPSLEIIDPLGDPNDPSNWRASIYQGGSPGTEGLPIDGDYDRNGIVNEADFYTWRSAFGNSVMVPGSGADGNYDGTIDAADYTVWRAHLGNSITILSAAATASAITTPSENSSVPQSIAASTLVENVSNEVPQTETPGSTARTAFFTLLGEGSSSHSARRERTTPVRPATERSSDESLLLIFETQSFASQASERSSLSDEHSNDAVDNRDESNGDTIDSVAFDESWTTANLFSSRKRF